MVGKSQSLPETDRTVYSHECGSIITGVTGDVKGAAARLTSNVRHEV